MFPPPVVAATATYHFVIYHDELVWPKWLDARLPKWLGGHGETRRKYVREYQGQANHNDPASLLNVLMQQTYLDWARRQESELAEWSMAVWSMDEYDCARSGYCDHRPPCRAIYPNWRHVPQNFRSGDGRTWAA